MGAILLVYAMNISSKKVRKIRILGVLSAIAVLILIFAVRIIMKSGVFYEKGRTPLPLAAEQYTGSDENTLALIDSSGNMPETRILPPDGYRRIDAENGSLLKFMRNMSLSPDGTPVVLHNGQEIARYAAAVYAMDVDELQQCADSIIRIYSEYLYSRGEYDKINFSLTNGTLMRYTDWREGKRLIALGSFAKLFKLADTDESYDCFRAYLSAVMNYAGTQSLSKESELISLEELAPGDMLLRGGTPGHVVLVIDQAVNENGESCFLLAQGHMPAQSFHIITNPARADDPWYYAAEMTGNIDAAGYVFSADELYRWRNFNEE